MAPDGFLILGGGLVGHSAAVSLRKAGFTGPLTVIGDEAVQPYDRTLLSKSVLQGQRQLDDVCFWTREQYAGQDIDLLLGTTATSVDFDKRTLTLDGADTVDFDKLLIATGASPIRLRQCGFDLPGVFYLRTARDTRAIQEALESATDVLIVGAGFIGSEVAASANRLGKNVTMVDLLGQPMAAALGEQLGQYFSRIHQSHGVALRMQSRVHELRGHERVEEALFSTGERIACDLVVVGVGVHPETHLFEGTGLQIDRGIQVDEYCQTNVPGVFAAGDVARWWHPGIERHLRVEHFDNAGNQGAAAARSMLGDMTPYAPVPYFWSDQYDVNLQFVGFQGAWDEVIIREYTEGDAMTVFYLLAGRIHAVVAINRSKDVRSARRLVESQSVIDGNVLKNPQIELRGLAKEIHTQER